MWVSGSFADTKGRYFGEAKSAEFLNWFNEVGASPLKAVP